MTSPTNINLVQMHEGYVAIEHSDDNKSIDPSIVGATHLRVYLSTTLGTLGNLYATVRLDSAGGLFFNAPKGWFGWVTLRNYNIFTGAESTNTDQTALQMFETVLPGYNIIQFFHDNRAGQPALQYAIGYRQSDNAVFLFKSSDYFTHWQTVNYWPAGTIENGGMLTFYIDKFGFMYVANRPGAMISGDNGATWTQLPFSYVTNLSVLQPFWNITEDDSLNRIIFSEYGFAPNGPHKRLWVSDDPARGSWSYLDLAPLGNTGISMATMLILTLIKFILPSSETRSPARDLTQRPAFI